MNKQDTIANLLRERTLNRFEALRLGGDSCLNTTISILRSQGYVIGDQWEEIPTRWGRTVKVKRYRLLAGPRVPA